MLPTIAKHAKEHGIFALKSLGQNFIFDLSLCNKIANTANISGNDLVIEIGPGTGGLTRSILELNPYKLIAIEKDKRCISLLQDIKSNYSQLEIIEEDALKISIEDILKRYNSNQKVKIIANLPYNIATHLIVKWLYESEYIHSINVMVQKEVAQRIVAEHSSKEYGRLSIISQIIANVEKLFDVSPESFYPKPKIWSSIISIVPKKSSIEKKELDILSKLTHSAFSMRRKMLKTSLKEYTYIISDDAILKLRAEDLTPEQYLNITRKIYHQGLL